MDLGLGPSSSSRQELFVRWDSASSGSIWDKGQGEDPWGGIDLCSPLIQLPRALSAVILSCVHHPVNQSSPSRFPSEQDPAAAGQEHEQGGAAAPHLPCPHLGDENKESLSKVVPGGAPAHCQSAFILSLRFSARSALLMLRIIRAHAAGMLLEQVWCGFLGYDALVVPRASVLMEIPSILENGLCG